MTTKGSMASPIREPHMAASGANVVGIDMIVAIWATDKKILVSDIPDLAFVIGPAPAVLFASGRAAVLLPIAVGATADRIEFIEIELFGVSRATLFNLSPNPFGIEFRVPGKKFLRLLKAIGIA